MQTSSCLLKRSTQPHADFGKKGEKHVDQIFAGKKIRILSNDLLRVLYKIGK